MEQREKKGEPDLNYRPHSFQGFLLQFLLCTLGEYSLKPGSSGLQSSDSPTCVVQSSYDVIITLAPALSAVTAATSDLQLQSETNANQFSDVVDKGLEPWRALAAQPTSWWILAFWPASRRTPADHLAYQPVANLFQLPSPPAIRFK